MQIKSRFLRFVTILFLAVCGVLSLVLLEVFGSKAKDIRVPIPEQAEWVVRLDVASLLKEEIYSVFFDSQNESLLRSIRTVVENRIEEKSENPPLYINFRSEMVFYGISKDEHRFVGMLVQLDNAELFSQNIKTYLEDGQTVAVKGSTALFINKLDALPFSQKEQQQFTNDCLEKGKIRDIRSSERAAGEWISMEAKSFFSTGKNLQASLQIQPHALRIDGRYEAGGNAVAPARYSLQQKGLLFSSAIIPTTLTDSINALLPTGSYRFPELRSVTIDYQGLIIENTSNGILQLPQLNAILESKTPVSLEEIKASIPPAFIGPDNTLVFPSATYYMEQLDSKTIFFGLDPNSVIRKPQNTIICIKGSLDPLVNIKADEFITMGMNLVLPQLGPTRSFIQRTESVDVYVKPVGKKYVVYGNLQFRKDAYPLSELTRLLIDLKVVQ